MTFKYRVTIEVESTDPNPENVASNVKGAAEEYVGEVFTTSAERVTA